MMHHLCICVRITFGCYWLQSTFAHLCNIMRWLLWLLFIATIVQGLFLTQLSLLLNAAPQLDNAMSTFNGTDHDVKEKTRVGYQLREQGAWAKYPVVMIPGFVTSGEHSVP